MEQTRDGLAQNPEHTGTQTLAKNSQHFRKYQQPRHEGETETKQAGCQTTNTWPPSHPHEYCIQVNNDTLCDWYGHGDLQTLQELGIDGPHHHPDLRKKSCTFSGRAKIAGGLLNQWPDRICPTHEGRRRSLQRNGTSGIHSPSGGCKQWS